jgi:hypothetical protein
MLDFLFNRGKVNAKAEQKPPAEANTSGPEENKRSRDQEEQNVFDVLEYGSTIKPGDAGLVGDCSGPGNDPTPCAWSLVRGEKGDKEYRIIL